LKKQIGLRHGPPFATNRTSDKFILRLPDGMRNRLAKIAERRGHSMNSVIIAALAMYFEHEDTSPGSKGYRRSADIEAALKGLEDQIANQHRELVELIEQKIK
jgi:predicted transcriptional regulator